MGHCDCHPWTAEDERIWKIVKTQPHTKEQWKALHDAIEGFRRLLIEDYKRGLRSIRGRDVDHGERSPDRDGGR